MEILFRHPRVRPFQQEMINDCIHALQQGYNIMLHAPMGIGKTDATLSAAISFIQEHPSRILFLTPKITQHAIALDVVTGIREKYCLPLHAVDVVGRKYSCADPFLTSLDFEDFYSVCERRRKNETCSFFANARGYTKSEQERAARTIEKIRNACVRCDHRTICEQSARYQCCPYEVSMKLASTADVIVADYFQLLMPRVRPIFLTKASITLSKTIVIIDEAHNVAARVRETLSRTLAAPLFQRAAKEALLMGEKEDATLITRSLRRYERWIASFSTKESLITKHDILGIIEPLETCDLAELASRYIEATGKKSACARLHSFCEEMGSDTDEGYVYLVREGKVKRTCLDPTRATNILNETASTILMSGTLVPLEMHRDVLGLDASRTLLKMYRSPFPKHHRLNIIVPTATTRYSHRKDEEFQKIAAVITSITAHVPGNTAVFFPSYSVLERVAPLLQGKKYIQSQHMTPHETAELLSRFCRETHALLIGVQGGSLAEGYDYARGVLKCVIMVGVALEEMSLEVQALIDYYERKFGKGWEYGYIFPAVGKALQASGRMIRSEEDFGVAVFIDERFRWKNYEQCFPSDFDFIISTTPAEHVRTFFEHRNVLQAQRREEGTQLSEHARHR